MIVVSDTSPLRALDFLELVPLLGKLFDRVLIPPAVQEELDVTPPKFEPVDVRKYAFIEVRPPDDRNRVNRFLETLDLGESEALALALETGTQLILMDEIRGRAAAVELGIVPLGALGVLLRAKVRGLISRRTTTCREARRP